MPKIFEYFGLIFYFYSNEHEPIHVHVQHGDKESIFELIMMDGELERINIRGRLVQNLCQVRISELWKVLFENIVRISSKNG